MLQNLYHLLGLDGTLRWVVLAAAVAAIVVAASGWSGIIFVAAMDLEFLVGLILYFGGSSDHENGVSEYGGSDERSRTALFAVEHTTYMFVAVILAHVGGSAVEERKDRFGKVSGGGNLLFAFALARARRDSVVAASAEARLLTGTALWLGDRERRSSSPVGRGIR
jgi:hypothetical protein